MSTERKLVVGQKLWFVPSQRGFGNAREVTVQKVGRKWATLDSGNRVDVTSLIADGAGFMSPGRCYFSQAEHEAAVALRKAWDSLRRFISDRWHAPDGVTLESINRALALISGASDD